MYILPPLPRHRMNGLLDDVASAGGQIVNSLTHGGSVTDAAKSASQTFIQSQSGQQLMAQASSALQQQIASSIKSAAFYSAYSKPIAYTGKDLGDLVAGNLVEAVRGPASPLTEALKPKTLIDRVKPTIVIEGSFGRKVIAPYGEANPQEWRANIRNLVIGVVGVLALYTVGSYYLGYKAGQRSRA